MARLLKRNRTRRRGATDVMRILCEPPVTVAESTTEAASSHIATLIARLRLLNRQIKDAHIRLDRLMARLVPQEDPEPGQVREQHDVEILASLPGVGGIVLATLLAEACAPLQRPDYAALRSPTGVAPVTKRSGQSRIVIRRHTCHPRLANAIYHWARVIVQHGQTSRAKYAALRSRGHTHARALRSVADRLLAIACAMLRDRHLFDPAKPAAQAT